MLLRPAFALAAVAGALALACQEAGETTPTATATPTAEPAFEASFAYGPCALVLPDGQEQGETVRCGTLTVLEDRGDPDEGTIELAVVILKATGLVPAPDPVIYLSGGPGGPALEYDMQLFDRQFARPIQRDRDIIFFDQRGVGRSEPALDCPEVDDVLFDDEEEFHLALVECSDRLRADGVDLDAYNSVENAADVADLARALDYQTYNLYGVSYGTRLALTAMRDAPDGIRSVVLDSPFPLQANLYADGAASFESSLRAVFDACDLDDECRSIARRNQLANTFFAIVDRLDAAPVTVEAEGVGGLPYEVEIDGDGFMDLVFEALYDPFIIAELPAILVTIAEGNDGPLELLASYAAYFDYGSSLGMYLSVQCSEEVPFNDTDRIRAVRPEYRRLDAAAREQIASVRAGCGVWNVSRGDTRENEAVESDIPTLVLAGEFDPITPPEYGRDTARTLSRSFVYEFRGFTHGVLDAGCPMEIVAAFLDDPDAPPDATCVDELPEFEFAAP